MNAFLFIALILFMLYEQSKAQFNPQCRGKRYLCDNENRIASSDTTTCAFVNDTKNKVHFLKPCADSTQICNITDISFGNNGQCVAAPAAEKTLPGEVCSVNSDCQSAICTNSICVGKKVNETCATDNDCDTGLFCMASTKKCETQQIFGKNCTRDEQCTNNCACNMNVCVYYYSFADGIAANNPKACQSGYVSGGKCYPALVSKVKGRPCTLDDDCQAYDSSLKQFVQYGKCTCGYNGGGFTYCPLAEGDPEFRTLVTKFAFIVARSQNCHTTLRFGPCRHLYADEYKEYITIRKYYDSYPIITFNDDCIKRAITWDYWQHLLSGYKLAPFLGLLLMSLLSMILLI